MSFNTFSSGTIDHSFTSQNFTNLQGPDVKRAVNSVPKTKKRDKMLSTWHSKTIENVKQKGVNGISLPQRN